jgi:hypothetical protein
MERSDDHRTLPGDKDASLEESLATAELLWIDEATWNKRIEDFAVKELLDLKNGTWLGEDESELTSEEFIARMELSSVWIRSGRKFEFWYDDGGMFFGHSILVSRNLDDGPTDAGIHG